MAWYLVESACGDMKGTTVLNDTLASCCKHGNVKISNHTAQEAIQLCIGSGSENVFQFVANPEFFLWP